MVNRIGLLALGDSYTVGESVPVGQSWPHRLAGRLAAAGHPADVTVVATTAWTSGELLAAVQADPPGPGFDLVSLSIGVNDQYRGLPLELFVETLELLLDYAGRMLEEGAAGRLAVSIPDWGVTPYAGGRDRPAIARDIDRFNGAFRDVAEAAGVPFVDVTGLSRRRGAGLSDDGLHPSGEEYARWVDEILPVALGLLRSEP